MNHAQAYRFGQFTVHPAERRLYADGVLVPLGSTDFRILVALVESAGAIVPKDDLISLVGGRAAGSDNVLYVHMSALRKALGGHCIVNQQGRGYRLTTPVQQLQSLAGNLPTLWANNPEGPTRLIGRSEQLSRISELLVHGRLVTLTGLGGVGKTRLALQAGEDASLRFSDGVWLVELASLNDEALVGSAIASALGITVGAKATPFDALSRHLERKSLLIVLDNCEHVIAAAAHAVEHLLGTAPGVKVLATSREPLSCGGEQVLEVPPLALPREGATLSDSVRNLAAVELFIERAKGADVNFRIDDNELPSVARICRRVDGLPLALEMAASWAGPLGLKGLEAKLDGSLKGWLRARSTAPSRHSTLSATLEWSYGLLSADEQAVLRRLAIFAGGFTMSAAEAVAADGAISEEQVFDHVASLIRKSMIAVVPRAQRYRLLETTRTFILEKLTTAGDLDATRQRHARYIRRVIEQAILELETTGDIAWIERYGPVLDDFRAALGWAMGQESDDAVALAGTSWPLWRELSLRMEGGQKLATAATRLRPNTPPALEARLRRGLGEMFWDAASTALPDIERAVFLYRNLDDLPSLGGALIPLGYSLFALGRIVEAEQTIVEAIGLLEPARQLRTLARAHCIQACIETALGHEDRARVAEKKADQLCKIVGADRMSLGLAANLVQLSLESGDVDGAISAGRNMLARLNDSRYSDIRGFVFGVLAAALTSRGDLDGALTAAREAAPLLREEGTLIWLFDHLALRVALAGRAKDAALIAGYSEAAYQRTGRTREPMSREARDRLDSLLRDRLLDNEIVEEARLGTQLFEEQTLAIALGD